MTSELLAFNVLKMTAFRIDLQYECIYGWIQWLVQLKIFCRPTTFYKCRCLRLESAVSDPGWSEGGGGGPRNMKYKGPSVAAIFFMTSFNRDRGGHGPPGPPWIRSCSLDVLGFFPIEKHRIDLESCIRKMLVNKYRSNFFSMIEKSRSK